MARNKSKLAEYLQKLGFVVIPTSRAARRLKSKSPPSFTSIEGITYATDDTGETWQLMDTADLTAAGFNNLSAKSRALAESLHLIKKTH